jgi:hypothetical protein
MREPLVPVPVKVTVREATVCPEVGLVTERSAGAACAALVPRSAPAELSAMTAATAAIFFHVEVIFT